MFFIDTRLNEIKAQLADSAANGLEDKSELVGWRYLLSPHQALSPNRYCQIHFLYFIFLKNITCNNYKWFNGNPFSSWLPRGEQMEFYVWAIFIMIIIK